jgi:hypothetical protein
VRDFEHVQVNVGILVPREADVAQFSRLSCLDQRGVRALSFIEDSVGILEADHLVVLHEVDAVGLETLVATNA